MSGSLALGVVGCYWSVPRHRRADGSTTRRVEHDPATDGFGGNRRENMTSPVKFSDFRRAHVPLSTASTAVRNARRTRRQLGTVGLNGRGAAADPHQRPRARWWVLILEDAVTLFAGFAVPLLVIAEVSPSRAPLALTEAASSRSSDCGRWGFTASGRRR